MRQSFTWREHLYFSNLLIAVGAGGLCWSAGSLLIAPANSLTHWPYALFCTLCTIAYYNLHDLYTKVWGSRVYKPGFARTHYWLRYRTILTVYTVAVAVAAGVLYFRYLLPFTQLWQFMLLGVLALFYFVYFIPGLAAGRLKDHWWLKLASLSLIWSYFPLWCLPLEVMSGHAWLLLIWRFIFLVVLTIPFDLRDALPDKEVMKTTLADVLDTSQRQRYALIALVALLLLTSLAGWIFQLISIYTMVLVALHVVYVAGLVWKAMRPGTNAMVYAWLDAQLLVHALLVVASSSIPYFRPN